VHKPGVSDHTLRLVEGPRVTTALRHRAPRRAEGEEGDCAGRIHPIATYGNGQWVLPRKRGNNQGSGFCGAVS
jgi:hypothetical protein